VLRFPRLKKTIQLALATCLEKVRSLLTASYLVVCTLCLNTACLFMLHTLLRRTLVGSLKSYAVGALVSANIHLVAVPNYCCGSLC